MTHRARIGSVTILALSALLTGCTRQAAQPTSPQPTQQAAPQPAIETTPDQPTPAITPAPATIVPPPQSAPQPTTTPEPPVTQSMPPPEVSGKTVLQLMNGSGPGQLGRDPDTVFSATAAFRIAGNGEIRVLDSVNKRLLIFDPQGNVARQQALAEFEYIRDFIIAPSGETYAFGRPQDASGPEMAVLRYTPQGKLAERIPLGNGPGNIADGISLSANDDLLLTLSNAQHWIVRRNGVLVTPTLQSLTQRAGIATPRSPLVFQTVPHDDGRSLRLDVVSYSTGVTQDFVNAVTSVEVGLPAEMQFINVDRGMNLYFAQIQPQDSGTAVSVWRVLPDGTVAGGARFTAECALGSRQIYVDQEGAAWTLCPNPQGAAVTRYQLLDPHGAPLPAPPAQPPAEVIWTPGRRLDAT